MIPRWPHLLPWYIASVVTLELLIAAGVFKVVGL